MKTDTYKSSEVNKVAIDNSVEVRYSMGLLTCTGGYSVAEWCSTGTRGRELAGSNPVSDSYRLPLSLVSGL